MLYLIAPLVHTEGARGERLYQYLFVGYTINILLHLRCYDWTKNIRTI